MPVSPPLDLEFATLRDGSRVSLRALEASDRDAFIAAFERLSTESRYSRFLSAMPRLTESQLRHLTEVDQHDHVALVALDENDAIVGVARSIRLSDTEAEVALTVVDDHQGLGVGKALLGALGERSREQGVTHYHAFVLARNASMLRLLHGLGTVRSTAAGEALNVVVDLG